MGHTVLSRNYLETFSYFLTDLQSNAVFLELSVGASLQVSEIEARSDGGPDQTEAVRLVGEAESGEPALAREAEVELVLWPKHHLLQLS